MLARDQLVTTRAFETSHYLRSLPYVQRYPTPNTAWDLREDIGSRDTGRRFKHEGGTVKSNIEPGRTRFMMNRRGSIRRRTTINNDGTTTSKMERRTTMRKRVSRFGEMHASTLAEWDRNG